MSGVTAMGVMAAAAVAGTVVSLKNGMDQQAAAKKAASQAQANAQKQEKAADEATNRANQKSPDTSAMLDAAIQAGRAGASGTLLTGAQGVDPATLALGKNTLLGK